eukprot:TRINITY_DN1566_c0_g1_i2.p1 TRINITY_DN1566_c0_g1~~TRINITY_DN1566_c0_g1_i2.p1  ORF type:complete len:604 (+),score=212.59 TRINITY_DN1566_c0_g1_i2:68-1813(+)
MRAAAGLLLAAAAAPAAGKRVREEVSIKMRDGAFLGAKVDCPAWGPKRKATIIERSTYSQMGTEEIAVLLSAVLGDKYCAMKQDMRGTGASGPLGGHPEQKFTLWHTEANDTADTLSWIAQQPWSNGEVYQVGVSSDGLASFMTVNSDPIPPQLKGQFVMFASADAHAFAYPGGAFRESLQVGWLDMVFWEQHKALLQESKSNEAPGPWWTPVNITDADCERIGVPSVLWAGWYDIFLQGNLFAHQCYSRSGKAKSRLVVDACGHCLIQDCPQLSEKERLLPILLGIDLFAGRQPLRDIKDITFYVMGPKKHFAERVSGNFWTTVDAWPQSKPTHFYLTPQGGLEAAAPAAASNVSYVYDPSHPVMTKGGNNLCWRCGAVNQEADEKRADVLTFTSPALQSDLAVTGALDVTVFVASNATDTDFTAKLTDVHPNGDSALIQDGIVRMRWRAGVTGGTAPRPMVPGKVYEVTISLWSTSYVFNKGHKLRVDISSSNSPRFSANPNNGLPLTESGPKKVALNTLFFGGSTASYLTLPEIDLSQLKPLPMEATVDSYIAERGPEVAQLAEQMLANKLSPVLSRL